jgi:hypothetical protein
MNQTKTESNAEKFGDTIGEILSIFIHIFLIWLINNLTSLDYAILDFIQPSFDTITWVINLSLSVSIFSSAVKIFFQNKKVETITEIVDAIFSFISTYYIFTVFPFDFTEIINITSINTIAKICLGLAMFGLVVATVFNVLKLFGIEIDKKEQSKEEIEK